MEFCVKNKAIRALESQKLKEKTITWKFQTASYIKEFFGEESPEYSFISQFDVTFSRMPFETEEMMMGKYRGMANEANVFLSNCIETLKVKGVYKVPKKNLLQHFKPYQIWLIVSSISVGAFWIGFWANSVHKNHRPIPDSIDIMEPIIRPAIKDTTNAIDSGI